MLIVRLAKLISIAGMLVMTNCVIAQQHSLIARHVPESVLTGEAKAMGSMESGRTLTLALSLPLRNEAALQSLIQSLYDPHSSQYRHYLSVAEFTQQYAPTESDYNTVVEWARNKGLKIRKTTANRRLIDVDGETATINQTFGITLTYYKDPNTGRIFYAPDREPTVDLQVPMLAVSGLDNATLPETALRRGPAHLSTGSGPSSTFRPSDMRAAYYGSGSLTGSGQSVAVFSLDGYLASDLTLYYNTIGMTSSVPVTNILVNGYNGACAAQNGTGTGTCEDDEQILDIVNVVGMAPGLAHLYFYEGLSTIDILNQIATDNVPTISCSWYRLGFTAATVDPVFQEFAAQGQTFLEASGDGGSYISDPSDYAPPLDDPYITLVGGTDLTTNGAGGPWASETGWADSGGGYETNINIPSWQRINGLITSTNVGSTTWRNSPDVAAEADFDNSTVSNGVFLTGYGGTSFAAPRWAGLIALANQQAATNGHARIGFLAPQTSEIAVAEDYSQMFHDITSGNNDGFSAVAGYDLVTGAGSPMGPNLIFELSCPIVFLEPGKSLLVNQRITSCDGRFYLLLQTDGNLVLYLHTTPLWATNTQGTSPGEAIMQTDGNFVLYDSAGVALWNSGTQGNSGASLAIQDDGNMVIYVKTGAIWATDTCCH